MSTWLPRAACTPECASDQVPRTSVLRRLLRAVAATGMIMSAIGLAVILPFCTARRRPKAIMGWARLVLRACGLRIRLIGGTQLAAPGELVLVTTNHVSWVDVIALMAIQPFPTVAKTDVRSWPIVGWLAHRAGTLFIDRERIRPLPGTIATVARELRSRPLWVCPEGTTWCGHEIGKFRPALFQAAIDAGVPIRPVAIRYRVGDGRRTTRAAFIGVDTLVASMWRTFAARGLTVEVEILPDIPLDVVADQQAGGPTARRRLAEAARTAIQAANATRTAGEHWVSPPLAASHPALATAPAVARPLPVRDSQPPGSEDGRKETGRRERTY